MKNQIPTNLKGFRDFLPAEKQKRNWLLGQITQVAQTYGFLPLETPTLEYAKLLTGKYGDEVDKLLYTFVDKGGREVGLRYDQTVPTARVLAQYQQKLPKYFRRYQTQDVFRAEKPQRGRYRQFRQFDLDIFGSDQEIADAEILAVVWQIFQTIGYPKVKIKLNDRQILFQTLSPFATPEVKVNSIIQTVDKLDKKSPDQVVNELIMKGLKKDIAQEILTKLNQARPTKGLLTIIKLAEKLGVPPKALEFTPTLARGLDYYTGLIFEVVIDDPTLNLGSLGGGGRYDDLIENLSGIKMPAVGVGLGFDRMVEVAEKLNLLPDTNNTQVMVALFGPETVSETLQVASRLRQANIKTEVYPAFDNLKKQFKTADQKQIPYVVIIGPEEKAKKIVTLKSLQTGKQKKLKVSELILKLKT